jgi:hypothetical protein
MTLSSLSYMWYLWILTKTMNDVMPSPYTKAYMELIGIGKCKKEHTYNTYIVKSNLRSKESWVIQSNQDVHVCGVMEIYMVAILILLCFLKTYLSFKTWKHLQENMGSLIHLFLFLLFSGGHRSTHCFNHLDTYPFFQFFLLFFF